MPTINEPLSDIRAQVAELRARRKRMVWAAGSGFLPEVGEGGFAVLPMSGDGEQGHAILPPSDVSRYLRDVEVFGLCSANAKWLGYHRGKSELAGREDVVSIVVRRGPHVVHDEVTLEGDIGVVESRLRLRYPGADVSHEPVLSRLFDRTARGGGGVCNSLFTPGAP